MEGGDAGAVSADAPGDSMSTTYNGSVPCAGCGQQMGPVAAMYAYESPKVCHHCRRKRHHKHMKKGMHS